jgi:hypothetical protein
MGAIYIPTTSGLLKKKKNNELHLAQPITCLERNCLNVTRSKLPVKIREAH